MPLDNGGTLGSVPNLATMLAGAYDELGWVRTVSF